MTSSIVRRALDPKDVDETIALVEEIAKSAGIEAALCGGIAMQIYGSDRFTRDVDFVVTYVPSELEDAGKPLSFGGARLRTKSGVSYDLIARNDEYEELYDEALDKAEPVAGSSSVSVVRPEHLLAMKLATLRPKDEEDVKVLLRLEVVDRKKAEDVVRRHLGRHAVRELRAIMLEVDNMPASEDE